MVGFGNLMKVVFQKEHLKYLGFAKVKKTLNAKKNKNNKNRLNHFFYYFSFPAIK
jgi:hypothetical protein